MNIGLIAHYRGPCLGIGQYIQRLLPPLIEELLNRDLKVTILASPNAVENTTALQDLHEYVRVVTPLDDAPTKRYLWCATRLGHYCRQESIEALVWLSNPIVLPWHPPSIAVIHDANEWKMAQKYGNRFKTMLRSFIYLDSSLRFAQQIVAISRATRSDLNNFRPYLSHSHKLVTIINGADSSLTDLPPRAITAPTAPFLLSVGRIDPAAKRLPEALALVKALRERSRQPWELHLVGGMNDTTRLSGEAFLKSVEHLPWVTYHGYMEDGELAQWYREATAVVFLSDSEGFGFPIAEAASFGRWAIVSQANQAGIEAGAGHIIPVVPEDPQGGAIAVLTRFNEMAAPMSEKTLPRWRSAATQYANGIDALLSA